jgi:hypothetical protein
MKEEGANLLELESDVTTFPLPRVGKDRKVG